jgi:hypothetical protein
LAQARRSGATALALAINVREWVSAREAAQFYRGPDLGMLAHQGWRVALAGRGDPLAPVWEQLGGHRTPIIALTDAPGQAS